MTTLKKFNFPQGSTEWWAARRGIPTASGFDRIITAKTGKLAAASKTYCNELIAERYALDPPRGAENYTSRAMQAGIDCEPEARRWYEMDVGLDVEQIGFITTDSGEAGCSPDGLVGDEGALELKCPLGKTHVGYLLAGTLPNEYLAQVHGVLIITERKWVDFLSYCPGLPPFKVRVVPNDYTASLRMQLAAFLVMLKEAHARVIELGGA